jgi:hypothetical protein
MMRFRLSFLKRIPLISLCSFTLVSFAAAPGFPLESINLKPSFLLEKPLPLKDLENFALKGSKSSDIQFLLDLIMGSSTLKESDLQNFLGKTSEVNGAFVNRFVNSAIGEVLLQELMRILQNPVEAGSWQALRDAMVQASADNKSSVIEILQNYKPQALTLDVSQVGKLQSRVQQEIKAMELALGISPSGSFNAGVTELFCQNSGLESVSLGDSNIKAKALLDFLFTFTASGHQDIDQIFNQVIDLDPKLVDIWLNSYFGEMFLRNLALTLNPEDQELQTIPPLKAALEKSVKAGKFSIANALNLYQPTRKDDYQAKLVKTITQIRDDIRDYQKILGIEGTEDINNVIRKIVCKDSSPNSTAPHSTAPNSTVNPSPKTAPN